MSDILSKILISKREELKINKKQAAELIGITPMYYVRFENDLLAPTKRNTVVFAKYLGMTPDELWELIKN